MEVLTCLVLVVIYCAAYSMGVVVARCGVIGRCIWDDRDFAGLQTADLREAVRSAACGARWLARCAFWLGLLPVRGEASRA